MKKRENKTINKRKVKSTALINQQWKELKEKKKKTKILIHSFFIEINNWLIIYLSKLRTSNKKKTAMVNFKTNNKQ